MSLLVVPATEDETYWLFNQGLALYAAGDFFEAHEVWEQAWNGEVGRTKRCLQALIQLAAGLYKHQIGQPRGTCKLIAKAIETLAEVRSGASAWLGVDLVALEETLPKVLATADRIAAGEALSLSAPRLPPVVSPFGILYLHGFASGPSSAKARALAPTLLERGFHVEVPDLNEPDFESLTVSRALERAKRCLRDRTLVIGSSMGGFLGALLAAKDERVKAMVLMAPAFEMATRMAERHGEAAMAQWKRSGTQLVPHHAYGGQHLIGYGLYEDGLRHPGRPSIRVPTVVIQGRQDDVVSPALVAEIVEGIPGVELRLVEDDHGLGKSAGLALAAVLELAERIGLRPEPRPSDPGVAKTALARED